MGPHTPIRTIIHRPPAHSPLMSTSRAVAPGIRQSRLSEPTRPSMEPPLLLGPDDPAWCICPPRAAELNVVDCDGRSHLHATRSSCWSTATGRLIERMPSLTSYVLNWPRLGLAAVALVLLAAACATGRGLPARCRITTRLAALRCSPRTHALPHSILLAVVYGVPVHYACQVFLVKVAKGPRLEREAEARDLHLG